MSVSIIFPIDKESGRILLGKRLAGWGVGFYSGFAGLQEPGEQAVVTAQRELQEECGIYAEVSDISFQGKFVFSGMSVFFTDNWSGSPERSGEMIPEWFIIDDMPWDQMPPTERSWLEPLLEKYLDVSLS